MFRHTIGSKRPQIIVALLALLSSCQAFSEVESDGIFTANQVRIPCVQAILHKHLIHMKAFRRKK